MVVQIIIQQSDIHIYTYIERNGLNYILPKLRKIQQWLKKKIISINIGNIIGWLMILCYQNKKVSLNICVNTEIYTESQWIIIFNINHYIEICRPPMDLKNIQNITQSWTDDGKMTPNKIETLKELL